MKKTVCILVECFAFYLLHSFPLADKIFLVMLKNVNAAKSSFDEEFLKPLLKFFIILKFHAFLKRKNGHSLQLVSNRYEHMQHAIQLMLR